jgi:hypothetical protein
VDPHGDDVRAARGAAAAAAPALRGRVDGRPPPRRR